MQADRFRAMNSEIILLAEGDIPQVVLGFIAAREFIETNEKRFTRFSDASELSQLNRSAGTWFNASHEMFEVVKLALEYHQKTSGLFDPSILPNLRAAGYNRSMDEIRRFGTDLQPATQPQTFDSAFASLQLNESRQAILLPPNMQIDLGGIAKGWIAEQAARLIRQYTSTCAVSAGGDIFLIGYPEGQDVWEIGLEDPRSPAENISVLYAQEGAVATSSVVKRSWKQGERTRHHLIDPRSGEPANTNWLSVTVFAKHAVTAEAFAKAFLLADETHIRLFEEQNPELTVLAVDASGNLVSLINPERHLNESN